MRASEAASSVCAQPAAARRAATGLLAPALDHRVDACRPPALEQRHDDLEQLGGAGVLLGRRPADDRVRDLRATAASANSCRTSSGHATTTRGALQPPEVALELLRDGLEVLLGEIVDVALEVRLRPAALVVAARRLLRLVGDLLEASAAQRVDAPLLAARRRATSAPLAAADERHERREQEVVRDTDRVGDRRRQRHACSRRCRGPAAKTASPCAPSRANSDSKKRWMRSKSAFRPRRTSWARSPRWRRATSSRRRGASCTRVAMSRGGRGDARIEIQVEADRAAVLRPEARQLTQSVPADRRVVIGAFLPERRSMLRVSRRAGEARNTLGRSDSFSNGEADKACDWTVRSEQ